jgi:hypothetical protein
MNYGSFDYVGKTISGAQITISGIIGASHLVGAKGLYNALEKGDLDSAKDGNGTTAREYMELFPEINAVNLRDHQSFFNRSPVG